MNKKCLKSIAMIIICILLILFMQKISFAIENEKSEYSKKYLEWLELPEEERNKTIAPTPFNLRNSELNEETPSKDVQIPTKYDLRDYITVERKNQLQTSQCWAFAALSAVETNIALTSNENYQLSERHMEYDLSRSFIDLDESYKNDYLWRWAGSGGYSTTAFTYLSRGSGPILEEDMPFENNENDIYISQLPTNVTVKKVDNMIYFPNLYKSTDANNNLIYEDANGDTYTEQEALQIRNSIKEHIMKYGGLITSIYAPNDYDVYNADTNSAYLYYSTYLNHDVTIIGWDDNYDKSNFLVEPKENGAYIVLNSWGEDWGENGIYYISYEDFLVEANIKGIVSTSNVNYDNIYQYDTSAMGTALSGKYAANVFKCEQNEKLTEIMIGSVTNQTCNVYINTNGNDLTISNLTKIASNVTLKPGYNTIKLTNAIQLEKDNNFAIVIELTNTNFYGIGVESNFNYSFTNAYSNVGESFVSNDGTTWYDIYDEDNQMNFSIKAYTQENAESLENVRTLGSAFEGMGGEFDFAIKSSYQNKGKTVTVKITKDSVNKTSQFTITKNVIRGNGAYIKVNCPTTIEAGLYNIKFTVNGKSITTTFNVDKIDESYTTIEFNDINMYNAVKEEINCTFSNDELLQIIAKKEEIEDIQWLYLGEEEIEDISGIENFVNLETLSLSSNRITDISVLTNLKNLKVLYLEYNEITDFTPLNELTTLKELDISGIALENLEFLKKLTNLTYLYMNHSAPETRISFTPIESLQNLQTLEIENWEWVNENELEIIAKLKNLQRLNANGCSINSLEPLRNTKLYYLDIGNWYENGRNYITDFSPLGDINTLTTLIMHGLNYIENLDFLNEIESLENFYMDYGGVRDASALDSGKEWGCLSLWNNDVEDFVLPAEEQIIELPKIFQQAFDENSVLYAENIDLGEFEWNEYGKSIIVNTENIESELIYIYSGVLEGSSYIVNTYMAGDIDSDTDIDIEDLVRLQDYLDGYCYLSSREEKNADLNCDGIIDEKDVEILQNYLNGVEGYETLPVFDVVYGDVNCDEVINKEDRTLLLNYVQDNTTEITSQGLRNADTNADGIVDYKDYVILKNYLAGTAGYETLPKTYILYGDVNHDYNVNKLDRTLILQYVKGETTDVDKQGLRNADVNLDGKVDYKDYLVLKNYLLGTEGYEELPLKPILYGDVNCDDVITKEDRTLLFNYTKDNTTKITKRGLRNADVNADGMVDYKDYIILKNYLLGTEGYEVLPKTYILYGDVNHDYNINKLDRTLILKYVKGENVSIDQQGLKNADVNADGIVDYKDYLVLKNYLAGIVGYDTLPVTYVLYGDVNHDYKVSKEDKSLLLKYVKGEEADVDEQGLRNADLNLDGAVDYKDYLIIKNHLLGLEDYEVLPIKPTLYGDVNCDEVINKEDRTLLLSYVQDNTTIISKRGLKNADVNADGVVDYKDYLVLKNYLAGTEGYETLPHI